MKHAAVSVIFREIEPYRQCELLMIQRAERDGDPWSGQMAFPGGRADHNGESPLEAALRETREEIGLNLHREATYLGRLSQIQAMAAGKTLPLLISPFIFELIRDVEFTLNHEVAEVMWLPLSFFADKTMRSTMTYHKMGIDWQLPCYRYKRRMIWGLTLQMIDEILSQVYEV
jgi:8-oxo-dGTP pyrophosphatase MutT (NUDIX family)